MIKIKFCLKCSWEDGMAEKKIKLEESFEKLDQIIVGLDKTDIGLEDSFALYKEGMKLLKACNDSIDKVEKKLIILGENGENNEL
jgi:exodeoxyribonuclease VII small subunit